MTTPAETATGDISNPDVIEDFIEKLRGCNPLSEANVKQLCDYAKEILGQEGNVAEVRAPVTICGDIHG